MMRLRLLTGSGTRKPALEGKGPPIHLLIIQSFLSAKFFHVSMKVPLPNRPCLIWRSTMQHPIPYTLYPIYCLNSLILFNLLSTCADNKAILGIPRNPLQASKILQEHLQP